MPPDRIATDGHDSYPRAIRTTLGQAVQHRTSAYLNNRLEQDWSRTTRASKAASTRLYLLARALTEPGREQ